MQILILFHPMAATASSAAASLAATSVSNVAAAAPASVVRPPVVLMLSGALCPCHFMHVTSLRQTKAELESLYGFNVIAGFLCPSSDEYVKGKNQEWAIKFEHRRGLAKAMLNESQVEASAAASSSSSSSASAAASASASSASASSPAPADDSWIQIFDQPWAGSHRIARHLAARFEATHPGVRVYEVFGADFTAKARCWLKPDRFFVSMPRAGSSERVDAQMALLDPEKLQSIQRKQSFIKLPLVDHTAHDLSSTRIRAVLAEKDPAAWSVLVDEGWLTPRALEYLKQHWSQLWTIPRRSM